MAPPRVAAFVGLTSWCSHLFPPSFVRLLMDYISDLLLYLCNSTLSCIPLTFNRGLLQLLFFHLNLSFENRLLLPCRSAKLVLLVN